MRELTIEKLKSAQRKASKEAIQLTRALEMPYYVVKKDYLFLVNADGTEKRIRKAIFGTRKISSKIIEIKKT